MEYDTQYRRRRRRLGLTRRGTSVRGPSCLGAVPEVEIEIEDPTIEIGTAEFTENGAGTNSPVVSSTAIQLSKQAELDPEPLGYRVSNLRLESSRTQKRIFEQEKKRKKRAEQSSRPQKRRKLSQLFEEREE